MTALIGVERIKYLREKIKDRKYIWFITGQAESQFLLKPAAEMVQHYNAGAIMPTVEEMAKRMGADI